MLMVRPQSLRTTESLIASIPMQVTAALIAALAIPIWIAALIFGENPLSHDVGRYSAAFATMAALSGLFLHRKMLSFPGTSGLAYVFPTYLVTYGTAVAFVLVLRLPYSGVITGLSAIGSTLVAFAIAAYAQQRTTRRMYVVPFGDVSLLEQAAGIEWLILHSPDERLVHPDVAIVADLRHELAPEWERMLAEAAISGRPVYHVKQLKESLTGKVEIEHLSENQFGSLLPSLSYRGVKRLTDIVSALILLPLLAIPFAIIAALIRLDSPGPAFFSQERMGYRGRPFTMIKFRTMRQRPPALSEVDARADAVTNDEDFRITRIGRFLRRTRLDELPQLINVLRGEMSIIGPRPEALALSLWYEKEIPFYLYRHIVRPGITGWAQVNQGHVADLNSVSAKLHYDFFYIKNFSAWLDVLIAFKTVTTMISGYGSR